MPTSSADLSQHDVAGGVAADVVDPLEVIYVHHDAGHLAAAVTLVGVGRKLAVAMLILRRFSLLAH